MTGLVAAAFTHRDSRARDPDLHTHVAVANKLQTLDRRWLSIDGRVLFKAMVAPVVMLPLASLSWTVILEGESPPAGIEVGDAVIVDALGSVLGSVRSHGVQRPQRIGWHGGPQVFTRDTLSMINKTIVGRSRDHRPLCVCGSSGSMMEPWTGC